MKRIAHPPGQLGALDSASGAGDLGGDSDVHYYDLGRHLVDTILAYPELQGLRRWSLVTGDAHGLYSQFGFTPLQAPERWMEIHQPDVYAKVP